ncbi:MAG: hypothetical protein COA44_07935 [Arcobacter sp.]|nr:MAG: hypothetical protein COA44_07935 [Arcobacter sp.]
MRRGKNTLFSVQKIFFGHTLEGELIRYIEAIAYFTNLQSALIEKAKHKGCFVFPFNCKFHKDRRKLSTILRANFH